MTVGYGTKLPTAFGRDVSENEVAKPGAVYSANFAITGVGTIFPGWEGDAITRVRNEIEKQGAEVIYIGIDMEHDGVDVQWKYPNPENAQAMILGVDDAIIVYLVITAIIFILAIWLTLTLVGAVKEVSNVIATNPAMIPVVYGGIAIAALIALVYAYKTIKGKSGSA